MGQDGEGRGVAWRGGVGWGVGVVRVEVRG